MAFAAAMRPKSRGSSTIGMKKSVVAMMQVLVIDLPYRGIVTGFRTDEKLRERPGRRLIGKKLLQNRRREFAAAAAAMRQIGQADRGG